MKRYRLEDLINDVTNVLSCVNFINELQIQGGEPFIYSDLKGLIQFLSSQKKIKHITIATNGTIIPKDELFNLIKKYDIALRISNYPITKEKGLILYNECQKRGIDASIYNFGNNKSEWSYLGGIETPRENDDKIVSKRFWYCSFKGCLTIDDGEINWCSRIRNAYIF